MERHRLSDDEWDLIVDLFPEPTGIGRPPNDPRDMMDGILWILRTGAPWRDLPASIGKWSSVWDAFDRWNDDGALANVLARLIASDVDVGTIDEELWLVDGLGMAPSDIKEVRSLTEPLQLAKDNGVKRALVPIENKRQFLEVSGDIMEHVDPVFYGDPKAAAFKALGMN